MANTYLTRTFGTPDGPGGGTFIWTMSAWIKKTGTGSDVGIMTRYVNANKFVKIFFNSDDQLEYAVYNGNYQARYQTTARYRDVNSWYHIVVAQNSTLATAADRVKIYVNGELITSFAVNTQIGQNIGGDFNTVSAPHQIGAYNASQNFNGLMSHFHFCDNYQYAASDFGSVDSTTGNWKIKTSPSVSYGTTGYWILKDGNTVTDSSANSNTWTVAGGTLTKTEDNPSNVFATLNPLHIQGNTNRTVNYGHTRFYINNTGWGSSLSTLGFSSGKFYVETKILGLNSSTGYGSIAIQDINAFGSSGNTDANLMGNNASAGLGADYRSGESSLKASNVTVSSNVGNFSNNDIIGMAIDMDNKALYIHNGGTYYQIGGVTGVPTSGASKTGAITIPASIETCAIGVGGYTDRADFACNFGNGYFANVAVSSAGTNASGIGIFEYNVPAGYTALSTKGLNL